MKQNKNQYKDNFSGRAIALSASFRLLWIGVLIFVVAPFSGVSQVSSSIDTLQMRIGEELQFRIEVEADSTDLVVFPEGTFAPMEVIESYEIDTTYSQAKYRLIKKYGLTQFDSGAYTIPTQKVYINEKQFITDSIEIYVIDVVVDTIQQRMFDIKPVIEIERPPFDFLNLLYWLIPILILVAAYIFFRRKKKKDSEEQQLPPFEEAMVALKELDNSSLLQENKSKEYYTHLTEIVKRYLDREVDDSVLESTSDELIARLQLHKDSGHFEFDNTTIKQLDAILKRADLVKFAKMKQEIGQAQADRGAIESIISDTHEVIPEPTEEELLLNQQYLEAQLRKRRIRRIIIGVAAGCFALLVTSAVLISTYGWSYMKDNVIGHPTKELLEGRWVRSEYGIPALIVETPKVLMRTEMKIPDEAKGVLQPTELFQYGSILDGFYILLTVSNYNEGVELDFGAMSEALFLSLENEGASNIITKRESYSTEEGIDGEKIYGEFDFAPLDQKSKKMVYEMLFFMKDQSVQMLAIYYQKDDTYGPKVKERIISSAEIEILETKK